jgi:serine/threonine protein kinase
MSNPSEAALLPELLGKIDALCDAFDRDWATGQRPAIEEALPSVPEAGRSLLLEELVRIELEWRFRLGERPTAEEYHTRFPACGRAINDWLAQAQAAAEEIARFTPSPARETAEAPEMPPPGQAPLGQETTDWERGVFRSMPVPAERAVEVPGYDVLESLGEGGMGVVFKARHRALNRLVALKMIRQVGFAGETRRRRFQREAQAVARLQHANVVQIFDIGEHDGLPYFALEYCPGGSLARKLRGRPLPAEEAATLVEALARAVHVAHTKGIVHRDLKPSNVLLGEDGTPKIADFGLARQIDEEGHTATGVVLGTPSYMAPEQAAGAKDVGPAADVYALGAILYECLTGRPPFKAETQMATLRQVLDEAPAPPSQVNPGVPRDLEAVCLKCLEKDPARRYPWALALAQDLRRFREGIEVLRSSAKKPSATPASPNRPGRRGITASLEAKIGKVGCSVTATLALVLVGVFLTIIALPSVQKTRGPKRLPVKVLSLDVNHFAGEFGDPCGVLGVDSFVTHRDDQVTVAAHLSRPAYAYLISFRPDGVEELVFPDSQDAPPPEEERPRYPLRDRGKHYGLDDGEGLQVFAVVVLVGPLPFKEWQARRGPAPWKKQPAPPDVVWRDDGTDVERVTAQGRSKAKDVPGAAAVAGLTDWLRKAPEVEAVAAVGFAVLPKDKR